MSAPNKTGSNLSRSCSLEDFSLVDAGANAKASKSTQVAPPVAAKTDGAAQNALLAQTADIPATGIHSGEGSSQLSAQRVSASTGTPPLVYTSQLRSLSLSTSSLTNEQMRSSPLPEMRLSSTDLAANLATHAGVLMPTPVARNSVQGSQGSLSETAQFMAEMRAEILDLRSRFGEMEKREAEKERKIKELEAENAKLRQTNDSLKQIVDNLRAFSDAPSAAQAHCDRIENLLRTEREKVKLAEKALQQQRLDFEQQGHEDARRLASENDTLQGRISEMNARLNDLTKQLGVAREEAKCAREAAMRKEQAQKRAEHAKHRSSVKTALRENAPNIANSTMLDVAGSKKFESSINLKTQEQPQEGSRAKTAAYVGGGLLAAGLAGYWLLRDNKKEEKEESSRS